MTLNDMMIKNKNLCDEMGANVVRIKTVVTIKEPRKHSGIPYHKSRHGGTCYLKRYGDYWKFL